MTAQPIEPGKVPTCTCLNPNAPGPHGTKCPMESGNLAERAEALAKFAEEVLALHVPHPQWRLSYAGGQVCEHCSHGDYVVGIDDCPVRSAAIDAGLAVRS